MLTVTTNITTVTTNNTYYRPNPNINVNRNYK